MSNILANILWGVLGLVAGGFLGFIISRWYFKKELKKNPPINEKQIRAMLREMGQKPSEAKIRAIMKAMDEAR